MYASREIIVSRHPAAIQFIQEMLGAQPGDIPVIESATIADVSGAAVYGNLPLHLAVRAAVVVAVEFDGPPPRGREYGLEVMRAAGATLVPYRVQRAAYGYTLDDGEDGNPPTIPGEPVQGDDAAPYRECV